MTQITKDMSIAQVLGISRSTVEVFLRHGMHCLGCPHATAESIDQAGQVHGIDVDNLVAALNEQIAKEAAQ